MTPKIPFLSRRRPDLRAPTLAALLAAATLAACAPNAPPGQINDPYEAQNRANHTFNQDFDKALLRPASQAYGHVVPGPVRTGVSNFAANLALPSYVLNDLLQAKIGAAGQNTLRFAFNTIFGIGGIFDPAGGLGLPPAPNDFGATLHVWGVREGAYLEVPVLGPSTERDLAGTVVDTVTDPMSAVLPKRFRYIPLSADALNAVNKRYKYNALVNSILHDSADSYAQERLIYLEKRHHDLGIVSSTPSFDPYEDPYAKN